LLSREASDITQLSLPVVQAAVEAIPLAGAPMKAVIGALLAILQAIDVRAYSNSRIILDSQGRYRQIKRLSIILHRKFIDLSAIY
jgi:hypothetical protein